MSERVEDKGKRSFLYYSAAGLAAVGAAGAAWPLIDSMNPAADTWLYEAKIDLNAIPENHSLAVNVPGGPVFIRHRTAQDIAAEDQVDLSELRDPQTAAERTPHPSWSVVIGVCTHDPCVLHGSKPNRSRGEFNGWFCICCAAHYDTCGRIRKGPGPGNLVVPPYDLLDGMILGLRLVPRPPAWPTT